MTHPNIVGRTRELDQLLQATNGSQAAFIAVFGRRRVGKTYLIETALAGKIRFSMTGLRKSKTAQQLRNFSYSLRDAGKLDALEQLPTDWLDAFYQLKLHLIDQGLDHADSVIFIDEVPWAATAKSDFINALGHFWNTFVSKTNMTLVICGSATAWMMQKILNDRGGLHNRVTHHLHLEAFTLAETEAFLQWKGVFLERNQIMPLYMALGGIPHYLEKVVAGKSAAQVIDALCFDPKGALRAEFQNLYRALFSNHEKYEQIVHALAGSFKGVSREELSIKAGIKDGGGFSTMLNELELSGFIASFVPFGKKKKDTLYRLIDHFSLFHLKFLADLPAKEHGRCDVLSQTQIWKSWSGFAFENICLQHIEPIKAKLGIASVHTRQFNYLAKSSADEPGIQIDLLIDRNDQCINLCEIKYRQASYVLDSDEASKIRQRVQTFKQLTGTKKHIFVTLIAPYGLQSNQYSIGLIDQVVTMDDLFRVAE
jgi:uncharacterized protein